MIGIVTAQQLRDSIGLEQADASIDRWIEEIRHDFLKPEIGCVMETVAENGDIIDHFDGRMLNPGHAIEAAWFIMSEGRTSRRPGIDCDRLPDARLDVGPRVGRRVRRDVLLSRRLRSAGSRSTGTT